MLEKKNSFKTHFAKYYTITAKNVYDIFSNPNSVEKNDLAFLSDKITEVNSLLGLHNSFAVIGDATRFSFAVVSDHCQQLLGYTTEEWQKLGLSFFIDNFCFADVAANEDMFQNFTKHQALLTISEKNQYIYSSTFRFFHKKKYFVWLRSYTIFYRHDKSGKLLHSIQLFTKVDEFKANDSCSMQILKVCSNSSVVVEYSKNYQPMGLDKLTKQEYLILRLLTEGYDNVQIGNQLNLLPNTINKYRKTMLKKTWCSNIVELINYALRNNLIHN